MDAKEKLDPAEFDYICNQHEDAILGAVFLEPQCTRQLESIGLEPSHFSRFVEREVYKIASSKLVDATAILLEMKSRGLVDDSYNVAWIGRLANRANVNQALTYHAMELVRLAKLRKLQSLLAEAIRPGADPTTIIAELQSCKHESGLKPVEFNKLETANPVLHVPVIDGLLRVGETANIIAPPKTGKSFLAGGLAWSVATGRPWLGHNVEQGNVLILDNELHPATLANRLDRIAWQMMIEHSERVGLDVISLRGKLTTIEGLTHTVTIEPGQYKLVIIDALYRMLPKGVSENDNAAMTAVYNELDNVARQWQAAIVVVHHSSKGNQGDKSVTDVGAGAGSISRAADTHIAIREHESDGHHVLEARTRSFPSPEPMSIKYEYPIWTSTTLEPAVKRPTRQSTEAQQQTDRLAKAELLEAMPTDGEIQQSDLADLIGWGKDRLKRIASLLIKDGVITKETRSSGSRERVFYVRTESRTESRTE